MTLPATLVPVDQPHDAAAALDAVFRADQARLLSILIGVLGDFEMAEECLQEAAATALERWPRDGVPANPAG